MSVSRGPGDPSEFATLQSLPGVVPAGVLRGECLPVSPPASLPGAA